MIFRLRDEPEQFRAGEIIDVIKDEFGLNRIMIKQIKDINQNNIYDVDDIVSSDADIDWALPGNYKIEEIVFDHTLEERKI